VSALRVAVGLLILVCAGSVPVRAAPAPAFHLEEAGIADVERAIQAKQLTATQLVGYYLKRIDAYNGTCVRGAVDPATGYQLGDIEGVEKAGKLNALITLNLRGKRSKTDSADNNPDMPDALETAAALDAEFARTGQLKGPLHGIPFVVKDQFDTFDMRTTSGAAARYANDRPRADAEVVARLRKAGAIILAKGNLGEYASGDRSTFGGTTCNPYDTSRSAGRSSGGPGAAVAANLVMCGIGEETGPSARNPASNESLVGIVATNSLVSRAGLVPASLTRDRAGVHAPIDGVTLPPKTRLEDMLNQTQRWIKKSDGSVLVRKVPVVDLDIRGWHAVRATLQMLVNKVMADNRLDALVYPTKTIPAPLLASPVEPSNIKTVKETVKMTIGGEAYERTIERAIDVRAALTPRLSPNGGFPVVVVPAGFTREVYDRAVVRGPDGGKRAGELLPAKPAALPVSIDFLGRRFSEPVLIRIAAAYEAATHHRRPPKDFPKITGEP
jgi:Asp-tRNA(Asn)/Glu-tRNA(Gln) amidotransferase A subunit family amidase